MPLGGEASNGVNTWASPGGWLRWFTQEEGVTQANKGTGRVNRGQP